MKDQDAVPYNSAQGMQPLSKAGDGSRLDGSGSGSADKMKSILSRLEEK